MCGLKDVVLSCKGGERMEEEKRSLGLGMKILLVAFGVVSLGATGLFIYLKSTGQL